MGGIKDIAKKADVSTATVSMVVNGKAEGRVSDATREKILRIAKEMDYKPNLNARFLKNENSTLIGVIVPNITNHFYPQMVKGIMEQADEAGYSVLLFDSENRFDKEKHQLNTMLSVRVAGIIVVGVDESNGEEGKLLERIAHDGTPMVQLDRYDPSVSIPYVGVDNYHGSYEMVRYLSSLGHRSIALIVPYSSLYIMKERERGYRDAMRDAGLPAGEDTIFHMNVVTLEDADECLQSIIESTQRFTAIYNACGDYVGIENIRSLRKLDKTVPNDYSVAGFDDIYMSGMLKPSLTTIRQPIHQLGKTAGAMLLDLIEKKTLTEKGKLLETQLVSRDSVREL